MATKTTSKKGKKLTIAQQAGYARRKLKNAGIDYLQDHRGDEVPLKWVPDIDILKHFAALSFIEKAKEMRRKLAEFKYELQKTGDEMYEQLLAEDEVRDDSVGGFTMGTFDKNLKVIFSMDTVQVKIKEELKIAESWWKKFLDANFSKEEDAYRWMVEIVNELLHNTKEQIDMRQIGKLNRMGAKIKDKNFHKFLEHLNQAYDTEHTKRKEQFMYRDDQGVDQSIVMTYSRVSPQAPETEEDA